MTRCWRGADLLLFPERDLAPGTEMSRSSFCNGLRELFNGRGRLSDGRLAAEGT